MGLSFAWCAKRGVFNHRDTEDSTIIYIDHFDGPVTDSRPRAEMAYNPSTALRAGSAGERVSKKSPDWDVRYIMAQGQIMAVYENIGGTWTHKQNFIFGNGRRLAMWNASNSSPYYYYADYLGSVREFARQNQSYVYRRDYYPFGQDRNASGGWNPEHYKFTGKAQDGETDAYAFTYRTYLPDLGRWNATDPSWYLRPGISPYAYVGNNPTRWIDLLGMDYIDPYKGYVFELPGVTVWGTRGNPWASYHTMKYLLGYYAGKAGSLLSPLATRDDPLIWQFIRGTGDVCYDVNLVGLGILGGAAAIGGAVAVSPLVAALIAQYGPVLQAMGLKTAAATQTWMTITGPEKAKALLKQVVAEVSYVSAYGQSIYYTNKPTVDDAVLGGLSGLGFVNYLPTTTWGTGFWIVGSFINRQIRK